MTIREACVYVFVPSYTIRLHSEAKNCDALIFGYYEGNKLFYVARTRNGFTPQSRDELFKRFRGLHIPECPFSNLSETRPGRWGQG